jgi:hypothetical protein
MLIVEPIKNSHMCMIAGVFQQHNLKFNVSLH